MASVLKCWKSGINITVCTRGDSKLLHEKQGFRRTIRMSNRGARVSSFGFPLRSMAQGADGDRLLETLSERITTTGILTSMITVANLISSDVVEATPMNFVLMEPQTVNSVTVLAALGSMTDWLGNILYTAGQQSNEAVQMQLSSLTPASIFVIFGAGLVTSLSPCTLSVLPLTLGYIVSVWLLMYSGSYVTIIEILTGAFGSGKSRAQGVVNSLAFSLGLATTLAVLGIAASFAGKAYGQIGQGLPLAASAIAVIMGLNLLEIIELQLPSFFGNFDARSAAANFPSSVQAYLAGLTFALAASPCSTPVLATLLAYVATSKDPIIGGSLLLTYTTGYIAPLLLAASFAGALQNLLSLRKYSTWVNSMSGAFLLGGGLYSFLDRMYPPTAHVM